MGSTGEIATNAVLGGTALSIVILLGALVVTALGWKALTGDVRKGFGRGPSKAQRMRDDLAASERSQREDEAYKSMTPAQRDAYYVHPSLWVRYKRFWGR